VKNVNQTDFLEVADENLPGNESTRGRSITGSDHSADDDNAPFPDSQPPVESNPSSRPCSDGYRDGTFIPESL